MDNSQRSTLGESRGGQSARSQLDDSSRAFRPADYWNQFKDTIDGNEEQVTNGLGWFSIGLGLTEVLAPRALCRFLGVKNHTFLVRLMGLREIAAGVGILSQRQP